MVDCLELASTTHLFEEANGHGMVMLCDTKSTALQKNGPEYIPQRIAWYTGQLCCTALTCALACVTDISVSACVSGMRNRQKPPHRKDP